MQKNNKAVTNKAATTKATVVTAKTAEPVKQEAAKTVEKPVEAVKQETLVFDTEAKNDKKETEKKVEERKPEEKKKPGKKPGRKPDTKKVEKVEKVEEVYVQFADMELQTKEVLERAKQAYVAEGHRESSIKSIRLYIKPEEHMAYYVINEKIAGGVPV